jgi:hypothetical protein
MKIPRKTQTIIIIIINIIIVIVATNGHHCSYKPREHSIIELAVHLRFLSQHLVLSLVKCIDRWWLLRNAIWSNTEWLHSHEKPDGLC